MGCASSTPMIATAGSELLKEATHVADDTAKTVNQTVQGVVHVLGETVHQTLDMGKQTVGTAVTGIAHDLETVYVKKSEALDVPTNNLLQKSGDSNAGSAIKEVVGATTSEASIPLAADSHSQVITPIHATIAPTTIATSIVAVITHDGDSLRTTTPEPEIEKVLAKYNEEKPPTPKPTLTELETLNGDVNEAAVAETTTMITTRTLTAVTAVDDGVDIEHCRPNTTEWEQYADTLSRARRLRPHEVYGRKTKVPAVGVTTGGPISLRPFGPLTGAPPLPPPPPPWPSNYKKREMPQRHQHLFEDDSSWSDLNYNNSSSFGSSNPSGDVGGIRGRRGRLPYPLPPPNYAIAARRYRRDFSSLLNGNGFVGGGGRGGGFVMGAGGGGFGRGWQSNPLRQTLQLTGGRKFDYNRSRVRLLNSTRPFNANILDFATVPQMVRHLSQPGLYNCISPAPHQQHGRRGSPRHYNNRLLPRSMNSSPIRIQTLLQNKAHASAAHQHLSDKSSSVDDMGYGLRQNSNSARSSTTNSIALRSRRSSPELRASSMTINSVNSVTTTALTTSVPAAPPPSVDSRNSQAVSVASHNKPDAFAIKQALKYYSTMHKDHYMYHHYQPHSPSPRLLPLMPLSAFNPRRPLVISPIQRSATSCLSKPQTITSQSQLFSKASRQASFIHNNNNNMESLTANKENKTIFISDLSSVGEHRLLLSPYKLRDRCEVCYNKYAIE